MCALKRKNACYERDDVRSSLSCGCGSVNLRFSMYGLVAFVLGVYVYVYASLCVMLVCICICVYLSYLRVCIDVLYVC